MGRERPRNLCENGRWAKPGIRIGCSSQQRLYVGIRSVPVDTGYRVMKVFLTVMLGMASMILISIGILLALRPLDQSDYSLFVGLMIGAGYGWHLTKRDD